MIRFVIPMVIIGVSIAGFLAFTQPLYHQISELRAEAASYDEALSNNKALEQEKEKLVKKYESILPEDLTKLQKMIPDNVDNIRLILEIEKIAAPYGMVLRDVKYDTIKKTTSTPENTVISGGATDEKGANRNFGVWNLEFSTEGSYKNFLNFLNDLEHNLRIVDPSSISFSSDVSSGSKTQAEESYKYSFKIKTYWLKN